MRHGKKTKRFDMSKEERRSLFANLSVQLIKHGRIETTLAKAKALRGYFEPLVTKAKNGTLHDRRLVAGYLRDENAVKKLFSELAPLYKERKGGYTRVLKLGFRKGDNAPTAFIEVVDKEKVYKSEEPKAEEKKAKKEKSPKAEKAEKPKKEKKEAKA